MTLDLSTFTTRVNQRVRPLTDKQLDVLVLIASDYSYKQIADKLGISPKTVSEHATAGYKKIGVTTAIGATRFLIQHGYVVLPK